MKLSSVSVSTPGHLGDVSRTTNFYLDRPVEDQGLRLCRPPCKPESGRYTDGVAWETAAQAGHKEGLRGYLEASKKWGPASSKGKTGCLRGCDGLLPGKQRHSPCLWSDVLDVVLSSDLRAYEIQTVRRFSCTGCGFFILAQTAQNSKSPEGHFTAAVGGLQTGFAANQG